MAREHSKEPWIVDCVVSKRDQDICLGYTIPGRESPILIASTYSSEDLCRPIKDRTGEANARRIVACVNACRGIDIEDLEEMTKEGYRLDPDCKELWAT